MTRPATIAVEHIGHEAGLWGRYHRGFVGTKNFALEDNRIDYDRGPASLEVELLLSITGVRKQESYSRTAGGASVNPPETQATTLRQARTMPLR